MKRMKLLSKYYVEHFRCIEQVFRKMVQDPPEALSDFHLELESCTMKEMEHGVLVSLSKYCPCSECLAVLMSRPVLTTQCYYISSKHTQYYLKQETDGRGHESITIPPYDTGMPQSSFPLNLIAIASSRSCKNPVPAWTATTPL